MLSSILAPAHVPAPAVSVHHFCLGLSAADRRWRVDCVEILGGTTDICLENRYLPMCFNMAGCVARAFFIIHAETVCFLFVGTESKRRGAVPHSSRDAP